MENKNRSYRIKIIALAIIAIIVRFEFYWIGYQLVNYLAESKLANPEQSSSQKLGDVSYSIAKPLAGLFGFLAPKEGKFVAGGILGVPGKVKPLKLYESPEVQSILKDAEIAAGGAIKTPVSNIVLDPSTPIIERDGKNFIAFQRDPSSATEYVPVAKVGDKNIAIFTDEQYKFLYEDSVAIRSAASLRTAEQVQKDVDTTWTIARKVDGYTEADGTKVNGILGSPFAEDGVTPVRGYGGSFAENLVAGSSKVERWNPALNEGKGGWEEVIIPEHLKKSLGSTPGDMDIAVTPNASGFTEGKFLNKKTGEMFDGLEISKKQFEQIRAIPEVDGYFGKGLDEVKGVLPAYSKVGDIERGFMRVTDAEGNTTVVLDLFGDIGPARNVFAGITKREGFLVPVTDESGKIISKGDSKIGKFNDYPNIGKAAEESYIVHADGTRKPYSEIYTGRTEEYLKSYLESIKHDPEKIAAAMQQYGEILNDPRFSREFRKELGEILTKVPEISPISKLSETADTPYTNEFLQGATPLTFGEIGQGISDSVSSFFNPSAEEIERINDEYGDPLEKALSGTVGISPIGFQSLSEIGQGISDSVSSFFNPSAEEIERINYEYGDPLEQALSGGSAYPSSPSDLWGPLSGMTWGQTANFGINSALIWNPGIGMALGEVAQIAIDGTRGPYDVNSEVYKKLTQPPAVGTVPNDPNHPLNSSKVKTIIENEQANSAIPDYRSTLDIINPWGPTKEEKLLEVFERERQALEGSQEAQRERMQNEGLGQTGVGPEIDQAIQEQFPDAESWRYTSEGDRTVPNADFWEMPENKFANWPFSPEAPPVPDYIANQTLPPIPDERYITPAPAPMPSVNRENLAEGNGTGGSSYKPKDTQEAEDMLDRIFEVDPDTGEVKLKEGFEKDKAMEMLKGNVEFDKEKIIDVKIKKKKIKPEDREKYLKDSNITVPNGTTVQDEKNRNYTADENPDTQNPSETDNRIDPEKIKVVNS